MTRNDVIRNIDAALQNGVPYATYLSDAVGRMNPNQLAYFCDHVAPYYMEGPGKNSMACKDMEYMARAVLQNKDVREVLGMDYRRLAEYLNRMPDLHYQAVQQPVQSQQSHVRTDADRISHLNEMIDKYVLHVGESRVGASNSTFCQTANVIQTQLPTQGWKFHISAKDLADYERLLETMLPEFDKLGVAYKVTRPSELDKLNSGQQIGKAVTIYPTPAFDINRFSPELRNLLGEDGIQPIGDAQISGRIYARYGKFRGENTHDLSAPDGKIVPDPRHSAVCPDFVQERYANQILGFYSDCVQRYNETGDFKRYLQEVATMTQTDGRSNAYMTLELKDGYDAQLRSIASRDPQGMSFIYEYGGKQYALIHNDYASQAVNEMVNMNLSAAYFRPEWDKRFDIYQIHPNDINKSVDMVNAYNMGRDITNGAPEMSYMYLDDGSFAIKVDTTLNRDFCEQCIENQIRVADFQINRSEMELNQQVAEQYWERPGDLTQDGQSFFHQGGDLETHAPVIGE